MLKVLHVIDSGGLYGAEVMLLGLAQEQKKMGIVPVIASIGEKNCDEKPLEAEAEKRGVGVKKFRMVPGPNIVGAWQLIKYARDNNVDLIHSHGYKGNILLGFLPKCVLKIPIVSTIHGYTSTRGLSKMKFYERLDLLSHRFIDKIVLVNKGMLHRKALAGRKGVKYNIIDNGIPISDTTSRSAKKTDSEIEQFCKSGFTIGSIGRLSTEKGYDFLIKAFKQLIDYGLEVRLIIIGEGYLRKSLERLIQQLGLNEFVLLAGYKNNAQQYISYFNVYVISSLTEGLPMTLLESMLARVPVIATEVGGIPDVIKDEKYGLLVKPSKPDEIADAVSRIFNDDFLAKELAENSYKRVIENYSVKKMSSEYMRIYKELVSYF